MSSPTRSRVTTWIGLGVTGWALIALLIWSPIIGFGAAFALFLSIAILDGRPTR